MKLRILNLYAGIGGNRKLWNKNIKVTAVEIDPQIAKIYKDFFPNDEVIIADAHEFLRSNFMNYDFIWSSPPCQTHSSFRHNICARFRGTKKEYPDMRLYQEIIFLQHNFKGKWIVENVRPYYPPLIPGIMIQRHMIWLNFALKNIFLEKDNIRKVQIPQLQKMHGFDLSKYKIKNKRQILRNCVRPEIGKHILECAYGN